MKPLFSIILLITSVSLIACNPQLQKDSEDTKEYSVDDLNVIESKEVIADPHLIASGHVGDVYVGNSDKISFGGGNPANPNRLILREQLYYCYEECQFGTHVTIDVINKSNELLLSIFPEYDNEKYKNIEAALVSDDYLSVGSINVQSSKFHTQEGIHINSTLKDFIKAYNNKVSIKCLIGDFGCGIEVNDDSLRNVIFFFAEKSSTYLYDDTFDEESFNLEIIKINDQKQIDLHSFVKEVGIDDDNVVVSNISIE